MIYQRTDEWFLRRIGSRAHVGMWEQANGIYRAATGSGIRVHIIDKADAHGAAVSTVAHMVAPGATIVRWNISANAGAGEIDPILKQIADQAATVDGTRDIVNISQGGVFLDRIDYAVDRGVVIVAGAGNANLGESGAPTLNWPSRHPRVLAMCGCDEAGAKIQSSRYNADDLSVGPWLYAPAVRILPAKWAGTSFASPQGAGAAACVAEAIGWAATPADIINYLWDNATIGVVTHAADREPKMLYLGDGAHIRFEPQRYLLCNPDLRESGLMTEEHAIAHYIANGIHEGREIAHGVVFDRGEYWDANPDVAEEGASPIEHFVNHGFGEGRVLRLGC